MLVCTYIGHLVTDLQTVRDCGVSYSGDYEHSTLLCDAVKFGNVLQTFLLNVRKFLPNYTSPRSTRRKYCIHRIYHRPHTSITNTGLIVNIFRETVLHIQISVAKLLHKIYICY